MPKTKTPHDYSSILLARTYARPENVGWDLLHRDIIVFKEVPVMEILGSAGNGRYYDPDWTPVVEEQRDFHSLN